MDSVLFLILAAVYMILFAYGFILMKLDSRPGLRYLLLFVTAGLVWDNAIIGAGIFIGEGPLLEQLNVTRYWIHAVATPLLAIVSYDLIRQAGSPWARKKAAAVGAWLFTAALIVVELITETLPLVVEPSLEYGALRYVPVEASGPPLMVIVILVPLLAAGITAWRRNKSPLLLIGTILMALGSAFPIPIESSAVTNVFELLLLVSLWLTIRKLTFSRTVSLP
ncbi:hypothetical protein JCM10914A_26250 [Paenibacillus sp. JCM 10914]|uniref:hypothetical protein n=1 Tax=Paenibacillus sp. JCM 10914 TaxID=1236974 RepID=UPI0003CC83BC|nr:hypothetical protein [Paenibacillus sp. JCM 10914]GAE07700.1 hypothetical protein JCM10914_3942 [Paenibacillus sp. JCM 10914]